MNTTEIVSKAIKAERLKVLNDTAKYYNSSKRNLATNETTCKYYPQHKNTEGCAIGRLISKKLAKALDLRNFSVNVDSVFRLLPTKLKKLGQPFLSDLQSLHDSESYWDDKGLTDLGKEKVKHMKVVYCK
jgi:hypothetical protein